MEPINPNTLTIFFGIIAAIGVFFGIYQYFVSRREAKIVYEVKELTDFSLPEDFYHEINMIPLSLSIDNNGNKKADNVLLSLKTRTEIKKHKIETDEKYDFDVSDFELTIRISNLNPSDSFNLLVYCRKDGHPTESVLKDVKITSSEGRVINKKEIQLQTIQIKDFIQIVVPNSIL